MIQDDWSFEMPDLTGAVRFAMTRAPEVWWLKAVTVGGVNAVEDAATFGSREAATGTKVIFALGAGAMTGKVLDDWEAGRQRVRGGGVFAESREMVQPVPVRPAGQCDSGRLLLGDGFAARRLLYVAAVDRLDGGGDFGEWQNPEVLNGLASIARRVTLIEGQTASAELRLTRMPR